MNFLDLFFEKRMEPDDYYRQSYLIELQNAWQAWQDALSYFEHVDDPRLVDFAIYEIEASKRKYLYLLQKCKDEGIETGGVA